MKKIQKIMLMVVVCWGIAMNSYAQVPTVNNLVKLWDKTYGGTLTDQPSKSIKTKDGGVLIVGYSVSNRGADKTENCRGGKDFWLLKIDANGRKEWDKTIGSPGDEESGIIIRQTEDEGYILATSTMDYVGGDKSNSNASYQSDIWIVRLDKKGQKLWDKTYGGINPEGVVSIIQNGNGFLVLFIVGRLAYSREPNIWLLQLDSSGNKLWEKGLVDDGATKALAMEKLGNGFIIVGVTNSKIGNNTTSDSKDWILHIDAQGNILWEKSYLLNGLFIQKGRIIIDKQNNALIAICVRTHYYIPNPQKMMLLKINQDGNLIWQREVNNTSILPDLFLLENNYLALGTLTSSYAQDYLLSMLNEDGNLVSREILNKGYSISGFIANDYIDAYKPHITYLGNNTLLFCTADSTNQSAYKTNNSRGGYDYWLTKFAITDKSTRNEIKGNIYNDLNTNCQLNLNERGLKDVLVRVNPGNHCTFTDNQGNYSVLVSTGGNFTVTPVNPPSKLNLLNLSCNSSTPITFNGLGNTQENVNFGLKVTPCASLTVDISSNRRRRCFRNFTTVKYTNEGYAAADNVQLKVIYPQYVVPIRSSVAWTSRQDTVLTYNLGRLEAGQTGQIVITDSVVCGNESIRGLTQCTKAIISPKSSCAVVNPNWDKADLQAFSQCLNASNVKLSVVNTGEAMRDSTAWRLFLNGVLKQQGRLKLGKGENYSFEVLAKGSTVRLEADQTPNHPVGKYALTTIERCGGAVAFNAVLAPPAVQLPINITLVGEEIATSCMPIIDSYDPNDKQVIPAGVGANKIVRDSDDLEFQIRFQNTGSDTAYTVVIRDTLSTALDIASLQVGASSHNYTYTVSGKNNPIITWTFDKINLPAQKQDDAGSNGFVKFKIAQVANNPKGTKIVNKAGIYFDFNSPIITNETNLTVGDLVADLNNAADLATIFVCNTKPQPTTSQAGADQTIIASSATLAANNPAKGAGKWRVVQGTGEFTNANSPTTTVNNIGLGENSYEWAVNLCNTVSASSVKITRVATPKAEITSKGDTLTAELADSYQWFLNGQAIAGATNRTFIATRSGNYTVEIKKFGNSYTSPVFRHAITGLEDELLQKATNLIPNPAQNSCVLQLTNDYIGEVAITITNLLGQEIYQTIASKNTQNWQQTIDLQHFTNGVYLVSLQTAKGKVVKKLVKME